MKFVYVVVWGDYHDKERKRLAVDRFFQSVFDSEEKAKKQFTDI